MKTFTVCQRSGVSGPQKVNGNTDSNLFFLLNCFPRKADNNGCSFLGRSV